MNIRWLGAERYRDVKGEAEKESIKSCYTAVPGQSHCIGVEWGAVGSPAPSRRWK